MAKQNALKLDECPMARSLYILGDRWSLLIIRDAFDGTRRFGDFVKSLGVAKNILADRLKLLVDEGVLALAPASDGTLYQEYALTRKGEDLFPIVVAFRQWGESYMYARGERHSVLVERETGKPVARIEPKTHDGSLLRPADAFVKKLQPSARTLQPRAVAKKRGVASTNSR